MSSKIDVVEHPNYRTINFAGAVGVAFKNNIQITIYSDDLNCADLVSDPKLVEGQLKVRRVIECRLLMEPAASKTLQNVLNSTIDGYEKQFGEIKQLVKTPNTTKDKNEINDSTAKFYS